MNTILLLSIMIFLLSAMGSLLMFDYSIASRVGFLISSFLFILWISLKIFIAGEASSLESLTPKEFAAFYSVPNISACIWIAEKDQEDREPPLSFFIKLFVNDEKKKSYSPETYYYMDETCQKSLERIVYESEYKKDLGWLERNALIQYVWSDEWRLRYKKTNPIWQHQIDEQLAYSKNKW